MDMLFWGKVQNSWYSVREDAVESKVNLDKIRSVLRSDIRKVNTNKSNKEEIEIDNNDDFWGGL